MKRRGWLIILLILTACAPSDPARSPSPPPAATTQPRPSPTPRPTPTVDTGWRPAGDGIETRELSIRHGDRRDRLFIARADPARVSVQVQYAPDRPRRMRGWIDTTNARLAINGGFFDPDHQALGLLIADGQAFGQSYEGLGGLFGVREGRVEIRSLIWQPYQPGEVFDQMVQSFPTLLLGDGAVNDQIRDDGRTAPRSVVGIDRAGRLVFLVSPGLTFSLTDLAVWLASSDLDLDAALNLDGGTSSGLLVRDANGMWGLDSWVEVPAVIVVR